MSFDAVAIEQKWKEHWEEQGIYRVSIDTSRPKYYVLDMFPYPSGAGLHVGHPLGYIASDIFARFKRMNGFNVLHPMGFDAFGLPAEQYAIETGIHPAISTSKNIDRYKKQLSNIGFSYDWSREIQTCDPKYYRWTQWIFLQLYSHYYNTQEDRAKPISELAAHFAQNGNDNEHFAFGHSPIFSSDEWQQYNALQRQEILMNYRLAYRKKSFVNWCEALGTVLANDEIKDGFSERGGHPVTKKEMTQWSLRITAYAERLLNDLQKVDWTDSLKIMQSNWIGRSEGATIFFPIDGHDVKIEIFTTRPDTIFGATFMVLAPEHDLVPSLTTPEQKQTIGTYIEYVQSRSERERTTEVNKVTGAFTGSYALNPFNGKKIPIWIAEYVLKDYGSGAIMAVPSRDDRDFAFATHFSLPIIEIIDQSRHPNASREDKVGTMINSDFITGMKVSEAIKAILKSLNDNNLGFSRINYRLRDANFSRQRYWGEPFPICYDANGLVRQMDETALPLELPEVHALKPTTDGQSPLAAIKEWTHLPDGCIRETDTMPGFAGSSWYFLRYMDPHNDNAPFSEDSVDYWRDVDLYIGGTEHAVGHLMYSRFWHKFLHDLGKVPTLEPFKKLVNQGMIQGVIEIIYLKKEKTDGHRHFICAKLANTLELNAEDIIKMPVNVDFVRNYGSKDSYLDQRGIKEFMEWRPDYKDAIFECENGIYHKGVFTPKNGQSDSCLYTHSEVGKMSKSKYNVINPDDVVSKYGADCFRMYEMFLGPIEQSKPWDIKGIDGVSKFLRRYWSLFHNDLDEINITQDEATKEELKILHATIQKVRSDIERFSFNTCVSSFMIAVSELKKLNCRKQVILDPLNRLLAPFAPFLTEEIHARLGGTTSVHHTDYPKFDASYLVSDSITYPVCINGKKRGLHEFDANMDKGEIEKVALTLDFVRDWTKDKQIFKVIVVPGKMINIVVK